MPSCAAGALATRRTALTGLGLGALLTLTGCGEQHQAPSSTTPNPTATPHPTASRTPAPATPTQAGRSPDRASVMRTVPESTITGLPGAGSHLAWTVDDGGSSEVIRKYAEFLHATGTRLTFFVTGSYAGWRDNKDILHDLSKTGQVQFGNHTWTHANLQRASDAHVLDELKRCGDFIGETWNVDAHPYFRPPFGYVDQRVRDLAASLDYTVTTMWYGTLSDSGSITPEQVVNFATEWFLPQHIVIGHANFPAVTEVFPKLSHIIAERGLETVTLNDVFRTTHHP